MQARRVCGASAFLDSQVDNARSQSPIVFDRSSLCPSTPVSRVATTTVARRQRLAASRSKPGPPWRLQPRCLVMIVVRTVFVPLELCPVRQRPHPMPLFLTFCTYRSTRTPLRLHVLPTRHDSGQLVSVPVPSRVGSDCCCCCERERDVRCSLSHSHRRSPSHAIRDVDAHPHAAFVAAHISPIRIRDRSHKRRPRRSSRSHSAKRTSIWACCTQYPSFCVATFLSPNTC